MSRRGEGERQGGERDKFGQAATRRMGDGENADHDGSPGGKRSPPAPADWTR